ncbi:MAG TPA: cobyrinate a,c-diamide synthase [Anaerolineae bacterium]
MNAPEVVTRSSLAPRLVLAGASSGVGKTTLTAGLLAALRGRGVAVQAFKAGPDYIDPSYHALASGRPCRNLDAWMLPPEAMVASFRRACAGASFALVEGVMGLYDGYGYDDEEGSTAYLAKLLDAPVVVVLNVASLGRSAGAMALGYANFDRRVRVAGFIANNAGSASHGEGTARAITAATGLPCFGWLPRDPALVIPERHLGLIPTAEPGQWEAFITAAAAHVSKYLDIAALLAVAGEPAVAPAQRGDEEQPVSVTPPAGRPLVAVARDEAFSFYYEDNLDLLRAAGARLCFFSPLRDAHLPAGAAGLYLGGGFPEIYAEALSANRTLLADLRTAIARGLPTYAECGGLMYLTGSVTDMAGAVHEMVGAVPGRSRMTPKLTMGYRRVVARRPTFLAPAGLTIRGHEFHYSDWIDRPPLDTAVYDVTPRRGEVASPEGYAAGNLVASYVHLHFGAAPGLAERMVAACRAWSAGETQHGA